MNKPKHTLHRETVEVTDELVYTIYFLIHQILHDPPLYAWFDSSYRTLEQSFILQFVDGIVYVNKVHNSMLPVNRYKIKDFIKQVDGKWKPDWDAIRDIKIYYEVCY